MAQHFFFRLVAPRPTFALDLNAEERALMGEHLTYVRGFFAAGKVLAFGPVLDPQGSFGMAILAMESPEEAERFGREDPSVKAGMNSFEVAPMRLGGCQAPHTEA